MRKMTTLTIEVPAEIVVGTWDGDTVRFNPADMPGNILSDIFYHGALRVLRDGVGGKDTDAEKVAAVRKRLDSWKAGSWAVAVRGAATDTLIRELLRGDLEKVTGPMADKAWGEAMADIVKAGGNKVPEKGGISADLLLTGRAAMIAKRDNPPHNGDRELIFAELLADFTKRAADLAADRAKAVAKVDVSKIDF